MQRFVDQPTKQAIAKIVDTLTLADGSAAVQKMLSSEDGERITFKDESGALRSPDDVLKDILPSSTHEAIETHLYPVVKARLLIFAIEKLFKVKLSRQGLEELIKKVHSLIEKAKDMKEKIEKLIEDLKKEAQEAAGLLSSTRLFDEIAENPVEFLESKLKDVLQDTTAMNLFIKHTLPALAVNYLRKEDENGQLDNQLIEEIRSELINIGTRDGTTMTTLRMMAKNIKKAREEYKKVIEKEGVVEAAKKFFKTALPTKAEKILKILAVQKEIKAMRSDLKDLAKVAAKDAKQERKQVKADLQKEGHSMTAQMKNKGGKVIGEARKSVKKAAEARKSTTSGGISATSVEVHETYDADSETANAQA